MEENTEIANNNNNPFDVQKYQGVDVPDEPIAASTNMIDAMINNDEVPEDVKLKNWWIFTKDNVLGFLDTERKDSKLLNFDIIKLDSLTTMGRKEYDFNTEVGYDVLRQVFETKLDRAVGSKNDSGSMNERKSLISQISENRNIQESDSSLVRESFLKKLMGRRK